VFSICGDDIPCVGDWDTKGESVASGINIEVETGSETFSAQEANRQPSAHRNRTVFWKVISHLLLPNQNTISETSRPQNQI
jgi:hypothetical protein